MEILVKAKTVEEAVALGAEKLGKSVDEVGVVVLEADLNIQLDHTLLCGLGLDHATGGLPFKILLDLEAQYIKCRLIACEIAPFYIVFKILYLSISYELIDSASYIFHKMEIAEFILVLGYKRIERKSAGKVKIFRFQFK